MLFALLALIRGRQRGALLWLVAGLAWFYLASTSVFGSWLMGRLEEPYAPVAAADLPRADAIVLLGGGVLARKADTVLGDLTHRSDRLLFAAALYRQGRAAAIVVTGGGPEGQASEAELTRDILGVMGVPSRALVLEQASRTTYDNALFTVPLLRRLGYERVLLVTSAFHMRRSVALFAAQGMEVIPAPTDHQVTRSPIQVLDWLPTLGGLTLTHYAIHEIVGYAVYRLRGWL